MRRPLRQHNEAFEKLVYKYYDLHKQSDLVHPKTYHDIVDFLRSGSGVRDNQQLFDKDFRAWVCRSKFGARIRYKSRSNTSKGSMNLLVCQTLAKPSTGFTPCY